MTDLKNDIKRIESGPRLSEAVIFDKKIYTAGVLYASLLKFLSQKPEVARKDVAKSHHNHIFPIVE